MNFETMVQFVIVPSFFYKKGETIMGIKNEKQKKNQKPRGSL